MYFSGDTSCSDDDARQKFFSLSPRPGLILQGNSNFNLLTFASQRRNVTRLHLPLVLYFVSFNVSIYIYLCNLYIQHRLSFIRCTHHMAHILPSLLSVFLSLLLLFLSLPLATMFLFAARVTRVHQFAMNFSFTSSHHFTCTHSHTQMTLECVVWNSCPPETESSDDDSIHAMSSSDSRWRRKEGKKKKSLSRARASGANNFHVEGRFACDLDT